MSALFNFFAGALALFYSWVHSYGFAIAALTIFVMAVTTPLTYKGTKSMLQMQRLQPQLKAIQARHKGDREKMMAAFKGLSALNRATFTKVVDLFTEPQQAWWKELPGRPFAGKGFPFTRPGPPLRPRE